MDTDTSKYLESLNSDKLALVDNLNEMGVEATNNETFTSLVPKVLDIQGGSEVEIHDCTRLFMMGTRLDSLNALLNICKNVTSMYYMFYSCNELVDINISNFDTSSVTNMGLCFYNCSALQNLDVSNFNTSNVTNFNSMFLGCQNLIILDVAGFNTSNAIDVSSMFKSCSKVTNLNVTGFNTSNVTKFSSMFSGCSSLTSLDVSNFDTPNAEYMDYMFSGCSSLTSLDVSNFDTSKVTNMFGMFQNCSNLTKLDISSFSTGSGSYNNSSFFRGCTNLVEVIINNANLFEITHTNVFDGTPIANGTGYVYVPDNMVETYKSATNWSIYADQIKGISELPTGEA